MGNTIEDLRKAGQEIHDQEILDNIPKIPFRKNEKVLELLERDSFVVTESILTSKKNHSNSKKVLEHSNNSNTSNTSNTSNNYNTLTNLTSKERILIELLTPKTIKELSEIMNIDIKTIYPKISYTSRQTGLLYEGLVEEIFDDVKKFQITKEGINYLDNLLEIEENEKERQELYNVKINNEKLEYTKFKEFFNNYSEGFEYKNKSLTINFNILLEFNNKLAETLIEEFEETQKNIIIAFYDFLDETPKQVIILGDLPDKIKISQLRNKYENKLINISGVIKQVSKVNSKILNLQFECPSCGNIISKVQGENKVQQPGKCNSCGRKGSFKLLSKQVRDFQTLKIEELPEHLEGRSQPQEKYIYVYDKLTNYNFQNGYNPGKRIKVNGVLKEFINSKSSLILDSYFEASSITFENKTELLKISKKDKEEVIKLSKKKNIKDLLVDSLAPTIFGYNNVKLGLLCQLLGSNLGVRKDINILLIGDPGLAKSQLAKACSEIIPNTKFVDGTNMTKAGLGATVVKDELSGMWTLQAGALPMANKGMVICNELDKARREDITILHNALEEQTINIDKAGINSSLECKTSFLATANPKYSEFDKNSSYLDQINLPTSLRDRFDLIFLFIDKKDTAVDEKIARLIIEREDDTFVSNGLDNNIFKKYIIYARSINTSLSEDSKKFLVNIYTTVRNNDNIKNFKPRQLETIKRLSSAFARLRLSNVINVSDVKNAKNLFFVAMKNLIGSSSGLLDLDIVNVGFSDNDRNLKNDILLLLKENVEGLDFETLWTLRL